MDIFCIKILKGIQLHNSYRMPPNPTIDAKITFYLEMIKSVMPTDYFRVLFHKSLETRCEGDYAKIDDPEFFRMVFLELLEEMLKTR